MASTGGYRVLGKDQEGLVKDVDKDCKNKWKFQWLEEEVHVVSGSVDKKVKIGDSIVKINLSGKASCEWCHSLLTYKGKGLSTLKEHLKTKPHVNQIKTRQSNYGLGSFVQPSSATKKVFPIFATPSKSSTAALSSAQPVKSADCEKTTETSTPAPMVPLSDRIATMEAMILSVMMEHSIPLTLAPVIVDVAKTCSSDPRALSGVQLSKSSAAYKIKFGLAKTVEQALIKDLQSCSFSLNIDEATCQNTEKVLSVLVSYFKGKEVKVHHLASVEINKADSATIYSAICHIFEVHNLPWENLISILCDSCAVMRGHVSGVEKRIREEKAPHLLDIDGDSCHHMQNIAKKFCAPFEGHLETMFSSLYTDFKWCSEYKLYLEEICQLLGISYTVPQIYSGTRWLSCYDRALDTIRMMDAYRFFYFSFLPTETDRDAYRPMLKKLLDSYDMDATKRRRLYKIMEILSTKKSTKEGKMRKAALIKALFYSADETDLQLQVYSSVLPIFKEYVCFFQTKVPMAHKLHDLQVESFKKFLCCFMRPEKIPDKLTESDISSAACHLPMKDVYIGQPLPKSMPNGFMEKVMKGYVSAAEMMIKKLPIYNTTLLSMSALDPILTNHTVVKVNLDKLGDKLEHVLSADEKKAYPEEVRTYVNDKRLPSHNDKDRVDEWWSQNDVVSKYPALTKVALSALTIFHGPLVESTFSEMSRIITKQTSRMQIPMLNAIQTIKYELKSTNSSALQYFERRNPKTDPVDLLLCRNMRNAFNAYETERKQNQRTQELKQKVMDRAAKAKKQIATAAVIKKAAIIQSKKVSLKRHIEKRNSPPPSKKFKF